MDHIDFGTITNRTVLEINLKTVWSSGWIFLILKSPYYTGNVVSGIIDTDNEEIDNHNLRYAAYRSLFIWLWLVLYRKSFFLNYSLVKEKEKLLSGQLCQAVLLS